MNSCRKAYNEDKLILFFSPENWDNALSSNKNLSIIGLLLTVHGMHPKYSKKTEKFGTVVTVVVPLRAERGTSNPKSFFEMLLITTWHRASENVDCFPKIGKLCKFKILFKILKGCPWNKVFSLVCLKAEKEETICFSFWPGQKQICSFWGLKKIRRKIYFKCYFWRLFFGVKGNCSICKKILMLWSLWFFESENFCAHALRARSQIRRFLELDL